MSRPVKKRKVCCEPICLSFLPEGASEETGRAVLTLDEFETIRLMDFEGLSQDQCARQMQVARSTVQLIYDNARQKVASALVLGLSLHIEGGSYTLCDGRSAGYGCRRCRWNTDPDDNRLSTMERTNKVMKVAVTYDAQTGEVFQHFGKTEYFKVFDVEDGKVRNSEVFSTNGQGHGALAGVLAQLDAQALICGGIGGGAQNALSMMGIKLYNGVTGSADAAAGAFAAGELSFDPDATCHHHDHEHGEDGCHHDHEHGEDGCCH